MTSERERMLAGDFYDSRDPELLALAHRARALLAQYNATPSTDGVTRHALLGQLLHRAGDGVWIEPPFFCDYGAHIRIGAGTFLNVNCVLLDSARITIGANALLGPGVQLLTATHPLSAAERRQPAAEGTMHGEASGEVSAGANKVSGYRTRALPIRIGDECWIGAGTLVMPGVTIGDRTTIGAGSVVTRDIPSDVLALGHPCRVVRPI